MSASAIASFVFQRVPTKASSCKVPRAEILFIPARKVGTSLMSAHDQAINLHYGHGDLSATILATLQKAGKNIDRLTRDDLRAFDEFHFAGIEETRHLAQLAGLKEGKSSLDVGGGLVDPASTS